MAIALEIPYSTPGLPEPPLAAIVDIARFHPQSADHHPRTRCAVSHDGAAVHLAFRVDDRYVRCEHTAYQDLVSEDSCVEFFAEPVPGKGYFNFEFNCGGTMLLYYIEDPSPAPDAFFKTFRPVPWEIGRKVRVAASLPKRVMPETDAPITWTLGCTIPLDVITPFVGPLRPLGGQIWRANFFKCADKSSHPHWASWTPIGERLRFHQPDCFAPVRFA